jgi:ribose transport system ATP-binding protein
MTIVEMRGVRKRFGGVEVLRGVDFDIRAGEVHALAGGNGAGKSTLMKILRGVYPMDAGEVLADGQPTAHGVAGVGMVFQEFSLVPGLTVAQNLWLSAEPTNRAGLIDERESSRRARAVFADLGVSVNVDTPVADLPTAYRQLTEIAKAIAKDARILVMDEPTASLARSEVDGLLGLIGRLRDRGIAIVYISHRLDEIDRIADRITVLRDGRQLFTRPVAEVSRAEVVAGIAGKELAGGGDRRDRAEPRSGDVLLEAIDLHAGDRVNGVSFELRAGEVLGIAGLMGSGRTELARCLFGIDRLDSGEVRIRGSRVDIRSPRAAQRAGIALVPEDRREQGLVFDHSVRENVTLPVLDRFRRGPLLSRKAGRRFADGLLDTLAVKVADPAQPVRRLSGGNQQKVVIAKWLGTEPDVLILDEPTAGIDVGAKADIIAIIRQLAAGGRGVIVISSEFSELLAVSDRVLVLRDGVVVRDLAHDAIAGEESLQLAVQGGVS